MAAITRHTWITLKAEFIRAARGVNYSGWSDRAERLLYGAYLDLATVYHHKELEETANKTLAAAAHTLTYPTDAHVLTAVAETTSGFIPEKYLPQLHLSSWAGTYDSTAGEPDQWAAFNETVFFDKPTDQTRYYNIYYLRRPAAPDFTAATSPETGPQWDEHILELALVRAGVRTNDQALAMVNAQALKDFVQQQPQILVKDSTAKAHSHIDTTDRPTAGDMT